MQEALGFQNDDVVKAASGFGGGIGMMADTCGALVGSGLVLGLIHGRTREDILYGEEEAQLARLRGSITPVAELYRWFQAEYGSTTCKEIRTRFGNGVFYDFTDPEQKEMYDKLDILGKCSDMVGRAAAKVTEMLWDEVKGKQ